MKSEPFASVRKRDMMSQFLFEWLISLSINAWNERRTFTYSSSYLAQKYSTMSDVFVVCRRHNVHLTSHRSGNQSHCSLPADPFVFVAPFSLTMNSVASSLHSIAFHHHHYHYHHHYLWYHRNLALLWLLQSVDYFPYQIPMSFDTFLSCQLWLLLIPLTTPPREHFFLCVKENDTVI